ncbi:hypothetical protein ABK040_006421 [Willaertia magna]
MFKKTFYLTGGLTALGIGTYVSFQYFATKNQLNKLKNNNIDKSNKHNDDNCNCSNNFTVQETSSIYNKISPSYDKKVEFDEWLTGVDKLRKKLMLNVYGDVLEIAAGSGRNIKEYERRKDNINSLILSDNAVGMLKQAKEKFEKDFTKKDIIQYKVVDAHQLPFKDNSFDCTIDTFGLCSFEDPVKVLKEMKRVTKNGGRILLLEHGKSSKYQWLTDYLDAWSVDRAKKWGCWWNRDIEQIVKDSGLTIVKKEIKQLGTCYYYIAEKRN